MKTVQRNFGFYERTIKRFLGVIVAAVALILLQPVLAAVALLVKWNLGSPVLYRQDRPGRAEKIFRLYKFRTMTDQRDEYGVLLPDDQRLTRFGRSLRATSLDEIPQLWNILKGDMSFVGPRPLLVRYLPRYSPMQMHRHDVRPGLTGLAQVSGRNDTNWEERFRLDIWYVEHVSFWLDCSILLRTVTCVFTRRGISSATSATMEEFHAMGVRSNE